MKHRCGEERMKRIDERDKEENANEDGLLLPLYEARQSAAHGDRDLGWKDGSVERYASTRPRKTGSSYFRICGEARRSCRSRLIRYLMYPERCDNHPARFHGRRRDRTLDVGIAVEQRPLSDGQFGYASDGSWPGCRPSVQHKADIVPQPPFHPVVTGTSHCTSYPVDLHKQFSVMSARHEPPRTLLVVVKLSDHFCQYVLVLTCECGDSRVANLQIFAAIAGWDAPLAEVIKRLRCSNCGARKCRAIVRHETKRDG